MATIETVTGPIDAGDLGFTLIHEHLRCQDEAVAVQWPDRVTLSEEEPFAVQAGGEHDEAVKMAERALERNVKSIVDPTAMFLGRDVGLHAEGLESRPACRSSRARASTPTTTFPPSSSTAPRSRSPRCSSPTSRRGSREPRSRRRSSSAPPTSRGITENVEKIHRAAAQASVQTGAPIMAHSAPAAGTGPKQVEVFEDEGVDLSKVQIAHCGDTDDVGYIEGLIDKGVFVGLDRFGLELFLPYEPRIKTALALLEKGHEGRLFLSADSCATLDWYPPEAVAQLQAAGQVIDWDVRIVPDRVIPDLRDGGMSDDQLDQMMVQNPIAWLTGE